MSLNLSIPIERYGNALADTLMMVGVVTIPIERKTFGLKATITRNVSAFVFSFVVAVVMGVALG